MKSIREIWALYDSFKRSFHNMNQGLLESDPNPIFIISRDKNIIYKNNMATKLVNNILEAQPQNSFRKKQRAKESTLNFLDIVHPNLKELFKKLLNDVMEDNCVSSFNFPLCKVNNQHNIDINVSNAYDIFDEKNYLYFAWFRIIICKTEWKNKSAFYMCFYPSEDVLLNEIFYQYTKRFSEKIEKAISNSDIICAAFINKSEKKIEKSKSSSSSSSHSSSRDSESQSSSSESEERKNDEKKNKVVNLKKNIYQLLIDNANNVELNNTILFFFKNQVEILYDYSLTIELYFNVLYKQRNFKFFFENKKPSSKKRIKLKEFKTYYLEYFYEFTREHKYQLAFKNDENNNNVDVFIEENYLRIIIFNIIVFMICYFDDKSEPKEGNKKEIVIKIVPEIKDESSLSIESGNENKNGNENDENFKQSPREYNDNKKNVKKGELSFIFECYSLKGDLNKIQELINQKNKSGSHLKSEIIKLNYLDVGILSVNYLLKSYYKTKLEMSNKEGEQIIRFKLPCDLEQTNDINHSKRYNQANANKTPDSNSFFSPLMTSKRTIKVERIPKNFYNYNENYNRKVLNIFYGIVKSPVLSKRHKRANPSFCQNSEIGNRNRRRGSRHLSQNFYLYAGEPNKDKKEKSGNEDKKENEEKINNRESKQNINVKKSNHNMSRFSIKQADFSFNSDNGSFKSERVDHDEISDKEEDMINGNFNIELFEVEETEKKDDNNFVGNEVLIFECQNNKELVTFLNNENKGEYIIKVVNNVNEEVKKLEDNDGKCIYKVLLINMGIISEIKYAEKICKNKGESLIFGYHFGAHTRLREKNSVKYDKRFDLSFSFEGIVYALKQIFINNTSII